VPATSIRAEHAEGPCWDPRSGRLVWVDQFGGLVHVAEYLPARGRLQIVKTYRVGAAVGAVAPTSEPDDGWVLAWGAGFALLAREGSVRPLAQPAAAEAGKLRMNDGKCDQAGRFWAGSMAWHKSPAAGSLYRLNSDLSVDVILAGVTISNGLAWSHDGRYLFYIDTATRRVDRFDIRADGTLANPRPAIVFTAEMGDPDGMCIDEEGCLWVAAWGGSAVYRCSPEGDVLAYAEVDAPQVSSCCFGGPDNSTLFITTSQEGMDEKQRTKHGNSGRVFCARVGVRGPRTDVFHGPPGGWTSLASG
jgi:sugar lactone lactonase YvrE